MSVAIVTDSTSYLPADIVEHLSISVVPLHITADGVEYTEGVDLDEAELARLLRRAKSLTSSRPSPGAFLDTYETLAKTGASEIVSTHLSSGLSGTCDAAALAARSASVPVHVVDSRSMGMTLGNAVLTGARLAQKGADGETVAEAVTARARAGRMFFYVHTLEFLRRGGRIGNGAAFLGSALAVRPLLHLVEGRIEPLEKVRTAGRALTRLADMVGEEAQQSSRPVALTVHHLGDADRARRLARLLHERAGDLLAGDVELRPIGAVAAVHLGPGALAVSSSPLLPVGE